MKIGLLIIAPLLPIAVLSAAALAASPPHETPVPWELRSESWRTDRAWYDGRAEKCLYDATRSIYGVPRTYVATAYTNKQAMDPKTTTKASGKGVEVFKHHWSERAPTENYDYDFSTAVFVRTDDLGPFKLTAATQEDCGASFKQIWNEDDDLRYLESVYFPGDGLDRGRCDEGSHFTDALPLVLRDFPFDSKPGIQVELSLIPSQKSTRSVPFDSEQHTIVLTGRETVAVPAGRIDTHRLELRGPRGKVRATFWFAAEAAAPWMHALVQYEDARGTSYRLRSIERTAYWERS